MNVLYFPSAIWLITTDDLRCQKPFQMAGGLLVQAHHGIYSDLWRREGGGASDTG